MTTAQKYFFGLLSSFYEKQMRTHPKKLVLLEQFRKRFANIKVNLQKSPQSEGKLPSLEKIQRSNTPNKSRQKDYSDQSDKQSTDSRIRKLKTDQHFKCQWVFESSSFVKSLMYAYLLFTANVQNLSLLVYLKDKFLEEYSDYFESAELHRLQFYWDKIILCAKKKEKHWQKQFLSNFKHFPIQFSSKLFQLTVKIKAQTLTLSNITSETIKKISQSLGYGICYYHVSKKFIRAELKEGKSLGIFLYIVYIQQLDRFMVSDRQLQKPSQDESSQKIKQMLGQNILKLLNKYEEDNENLVNLKSLVDLDTSKMGSEISKMQFASQRGYKINAKQTSLKAI